MRSKLSATSEPKWQLRQQKQKVSKKSSPGRFTPGIPDLTECPLPLFFRAEARGRPWPSSSPGSTVRERSPWSPLDVLAFSKYFCGVSAVLLVCEYLQGSLRSIIPKWALSFGQTGLLRKETGAFENLPGSSMIVLSETLESSSVVFCEGHSRPWDTAGVIRDASARMSSPSVRVRFLLITVVKNSLNLLGFSDCV